MCDLLDYFNVILASCGLYLNEEAGYKSAIAGSIFAISRGI